MSDVLYHKMLASENSKSSKGLDEVLRMTPLNLRAKTELALEEIRAFGRVIVAFSGGVDSSLVAWLAVQSLGKGAVAVTANSPSLPQTELNETRRLAKEIGIRQIIIKTSELDDANYTSNPSNRCYFCKKELSQRLMRLAREMNVSFILDGTNADDLSGHRPGAAALSEANVKRPLADAGITKAEVRELAELCGLSNFDKPSMPCLSSRVQYGQLITAERLSRIERSETFIRSLTGVKELRVRDHGNLARIEVGGDERRVFFDEQLLDKVSAALRVFGFMYVTFDLLGYRSGSMNEPLSRSKPKARTS